MRNLLLVGHLNEAREIPHDGMLVASVSSPASWRGLQVNAVYATAKAKAHPKYAEALDDLTICTLARDKWAGAERVL